MLNFLASFVVIYNHLLNLKFKCLYSILLEVDFLYEILRKNSLTQLWLQKVAITKAKIKSPESLFLLAPLIEMPQLATCDCSAMHPQIRLQPHP